MAKYKTSMETWIIILIVSLIAVVIGGCAMVWYLRYWKPKQIINKKKRDENEYKNLKEQFDH